MKWVYPEFLFALLVLVIPILIHLFHFRKYKTIYFSSIAFVKSVEQQQKNPRKIKHLLVLIARMLAFTCLVIAFAQPYFPHSDSSKKDIQLIGVYVDNSFSMSRIGTQGELLAQAKELASSIIDKAPRNTQYVLFTNELSGNEKQTLTQVKFVDQVAKINYSPIYRSKEEVLSFWNQWIEDAQKEGNIKSKPNLIYLSDFQKNKQSNLIKKFKSIPSISPIRLTPQNKGNLFVDSIWFETPIQKLGSAQTLSIRVVNTGNEPIESAVVSVQIGKMKRDLFAEIPSNGSDTVQLNYFNQEAGISKGIVSINDKQMNQDDSFYFNYEVKKSQSVLIVNGEDAVENVGIVYGLDDFYKIKEVSTNQASSEDLEKIDLIVLNGLNQIPSNLTTELANYQDEKESILLIPGTNISPTGWNALLEKLELPVINGTQTIGLAVQKLNLKDPFFHGIFEGKPENISIPAAAKAYRLMPNSKTLSADLINYQNGTPFFVKSTGKGNAYLFSTSLKQEFSTFTSNQLFSTLLLHVGNLSQRQNPYFLVIGSDGSYPLKNTSSSENPVHLINKQVDYIPILFLKNKRQTISVQGLEAIRFLEAGNYNILQDGKSLGTVSMNYNRLESQTAESTQEEIKKDFEQAGIHVNNLQDGSNWNSASLLEIGENYDIWLWFVFFAGIFVLCEMALLIFYKK
ncbi:BatA domain-containing protein [Fluviicola taffensis]|uniref:Double-transmembrane region domain protein n=1 Tax=Fluviicola taffensis (strain DSM 16823 / NCIMB 13979 / RW262) TaxID=755732 RepID=F2ICF8_FLUTR|nr:BatA domain-containing protein [Fluviicola taffensis]AEA45428.1 double-transmembrane region domain protein [Fluviicola taffensis DSM 16823]